MHLPSLQYYDNLYQRRKLNRPVAEIDPIEVEISKQRDAELKENLFLSGAADDVARTTRVARQAGEPPALVEGRVDEYEKAFNADRFVTVGNEYPPIGRWAINNPRGAAAAADDSEGLSILGRAWNALGSASASFVDFQRKIPSRLIAGTSSAANSIYDVFDQIGEFNDAVLRPIDYGIAAIANPVLDAFGIDYQVDPDAVSKTRQELKNRRRAGAEEFQSSVRQRGRGFVSENLLAGLENIPLTATALLTRNPNAGAAILGAATEGSSYQEARDAGKGLLQSTIYGVSQGAIETATEKIPISRFISDFVNKSPIGKTLLNQLVTEIPGEQVATVLQDLNEWAVLNPEKSFSEYIKERPGKAAETLLQTIGGVGGSVSATKAAQVTIDAAVKATDRITQARQARTEAKALDGVIEAAQSSKLAQRDPEAFADLVKSLSEENDIDNVYIEADSLREYFQSDTFNPNSPLAQYQLQFEEAIATGGDVVVPVENISLFSEIWPQIKDSVRISAGGITRAEADAIEANLPELLNGFATDIADNERSTRANRDAIDKLAAKIEAKLKSAGFAPSAVATQAQFIAQRYQTRASRLGVEITGKEVDDLEVRQVLPQGLAEFVANDGLGEVINAAKSGSKPKGRNAAKIRKAVSEIQKIASEKKVDINSATEADIKALVEEYAGEQANIFNQQPGSPRGRIIFPSAGYGTGKTIIELFESRNLSTFLHETGHLWLEELRADALLDGAPEQIKSDWEAVKKWFSDNNYEATDGDISRDAHELFARGVERYLLEGKGPTPNLRRIFETFRSWLVSIYKNVDNLKAPITPEIRDVLDRLIATDEQIAETRSAQFQPAPSASDLGMTAAEYEAYLKISDESAAKSKQSLIDKAMKAVRSRALDSYREAKQEVTEQVRDRREKSPLFRAMSILDKTPISSEWLKSEYGDGYTTILPRGRRPFYSKDGVHPDIVAESSGYGSGKALVDELIEEQKRHVAAKESGDNRGIRQRKIGDEVDSILNARFGDPLNDGTIEYEALEAVHNELAGEALAAELRGLSRLTGRTATPYSLAKQFARDKIRSGKINENATLSAINRYARSAAKAGREFTDALARGDRQRAFAAKRAQLLNNALVAESKAAYHDVDRAVRRLEKIARKKTIKSVDQDYLDQAHALLENVDLKKRSQRQVDRQESFEEWATARSAEGHDIAVPASFAITIGKTNWSRLSVENLLGLDDAVKQIIHIGRFKQTLIDNKEQRDFAEIVAEAEETAAKLPQKKPSNLLEPSYFDAIKSKILSIDAALLKMETVFDWLDGNDSTGVFNRIVFSPIADAQHRSQQMVADYIGRLNTALESVPTETLRKWDDKIEIPELLNRETGQPFQFKRHQIISMALNVGNQSNLDKLAGGYGWNRDAVLGALSERLTKEEWDYVQNVWDVIDSLWPEIQGLEKRLNGVSPEKIEPTSVNTPHGTYRGGYYPVVYDPRRNYDSEANAAKGESLFENIYTRASTPRGFTKERTNVERPIHLSLGVINRHVTEVIHDITHREAIIQADKFLSDKRVIKAVDNSLGREIRSNFRPWLQRIANEWAYDRAGAAGIEGFVNTLRTNATIVGMGFRVSTILMQAAGYSNSFEKVGSGWVARRLKDVANPEAWKFVLEKSGEVAARMDNLDRDIRDNLRKAQRKIGGVSAIKKYAFYGIGYMDRVVVIPTWLGAYDKAIASGLSDEDAVREADKSIRQSQGAGAAKDLAAVQSGRGTFGALGKLLTMFYSYMSAFYQRQRTFARDVRSASLSDVPNLVARAWWLFVVPPLLSEILAGRGPDDDEDWGAWSIEKITFQIFGPIPIARDVVPVAWAKAQNKPTFNYRLSPVQSGAESVINVVGDAGRIADGKETKRATRNALETVGYATGLVPGQVATAAQFLVDVSDGDKDPESFKDWYDGLTTGKIDE